MDLVLLIPAFIICFFLLYLLCKQDFVLLRQNISLNQILDAALLTVFTAYIVGRLLFLFNNFDLSLLNIIRFFHVIKFPGLSYLGFFLGGLIALWVVFRNKKSALRIFDIFSISFFPLFFLSLLFRHYPKDLALVITSLSITLSVILFVFSLKSHYKYLLRDGSISLILLIIVSLDTLSYEYLNIKRYILLSGLSLSQILGICFTSIGIVLLLINQKKVKI